MKDPAKVVREMTPSLEAAGTVRQNQDHHISRATLNFWLDAGLMVLFVSLAIVATIVQFVFPPGTGARGWTLWRMDFNQWSSLQYGLLCAFGVASEVREFLAGNPSDDLALIRVDSVQLPAIPLADRDARIGAKLLAISHPDSHDFSMTFGRTTRNFQTTRHAMPSLRMGVTADFSEGSSGGPRLDVFGNVVGVVSATRGNASKMVHREAIPVSSLRKLTGNSTQWKQTSTESIYLLPQSSR